MTKYKFTFPVGFLRPAYSIVLPSQLARVFPVLVQVRTLHPRREARADSTKDRGYRTTRFSIKYADTLRQKSNFSNFFNLPSHIELRATCDERRLYFRIKHAGSSNYRACPELAEALSPFGYAQGKLRRRAEESGQRRGDSHLSGSSTSLRCAPFRPVLE